MFHKKIAGCIIIEDNNVLLLKKKSNNWFELPGGTIEENESPEQTAVRELQEEIACTVELLSLYQEKEFEHKGRLYHSTWFFARILPGNIPCIAEPEGYSDLAFIPFDQLSGIPLSPTVQDMLLSIQISSR